MLVGGSALAHDNADTAGSIARSSLPAGEMHIAADEGDDEGRQNAENHHEHWDALGCVSNADHCEHDAHARGYEHSRVIENPEACHHEPHMLCQARK